MSPRSPSETVETGFSSSDKLAMESVLLRFEHLKRFGATQIKGLGTRTYK